MEQLKVGRFITKKWKEQNLTQEVFPIKPFQNGKQENVCPIMP